MLKSEESEVENLKAIIKTKAEKHSLFYRNLCGELASDCGSEQQGATLDGSGTSKQLRQRRTGVYEMGKLEEEGSIFKSVRELRENYLKKLETTAKKLQLPELRRERKMEKDNGIDEALLVPPTSGYCSGSDDERWFQKVSAFKLFLIFHTTR